MPKKTLTPDPYSTQCVQDAIMLGWKTLEILDVGAGTVEVIDLKDEKKAADEIRWVYRFFPADKIEEIEQDFINGQTIKTIGFIRRLVK